MQHPVRIVLYQDRWPVQFAEIGTGLRAMLGERAMRIDHIGSTAVSGLAAKPIIDVQISVGDFEPLESLVEAIESLGYVFNPENPDRTKRYFRDARDGQHVHIHVRRTGSWAEQFALLFRDYLRSHPEDAAAYGTLKMRLAETFGNDREGYTEAKTEFIFRTIARAHVWTMETGWQPGASDA
jgi:GrpB-like predicted nucleotidyltransferase (UPF0157 family)